ncbi:MAG TPA: hypothetical protein VM029_05650, partial [Opitutaceae bacterium]|nr:hypothetical protein [Opitutaceae bacterium]
MRVALLAFLIAVTHAAEPAGKEKFAGTFAPAQAGHARLAPDGRHLAYSFREGTEIVVGVLDIDAAAVTMRQSVGFEQEPVFGVGSPITIYTYVTNLRWVSSRRLIIETNNRGIIAMDADGQNPIWLANPKHAPWMVSYSSPSL